MVFGDCAHLADEEDADALHDFSEASLEDSLVDVDLGRRSTS